MYNNIVNSEIIAKCNYVINLYMVTVRELLQNVKKSSAYRFHVDQRPMFLGIWFQTIHFILKFRRFQKMWLRHDDWGICIEMINHWLNHEFLLTPGYVHHTQQDRKS